MWHPNLCLLKLRQQDVQMLERLPGAGAVVAVGVVLGTGAGAGVGKQQFQVPEKLPQLLR
jgi:hypothetical protein